MQVYLGSLYVNDFNRFGRTYPVTLQADERFAPEPRIIGPVCNSARGGPDGAAGLARHHVTRPRGPGATGRYNGYLPPTINGGPAPGHSTGEAQHGDWRRRQGSAPQGMRL